MPKRDPEPPGAPSVDRRLRVDSRQGAAWLLLALVPMLALVGAFGQQVAIVEAGAGELDIRVEYPERTRYRLTELLVVEVTPRSDLEQVEVAIASDYLDRFASVSATPEIHAIRDGEALMDVGSVTGGTTRRITVELQADRYWLSDGWLEIRSGGAVLQRIVLRTFVFP
jgi:hypothetical protein